MGQYPAMRQNDRSLSCSAPCARQWVLGACNWTECGSIGSIVAVIVTLLEIPSVEENVTRMLQNRHNARTFFFGNPMYTFFDVPHTPKK